MRVSINDDKKIVGIWYAKNENTQIPAEISPIIENYRKNKYVICQYISGNGDIVKLTSDLLVNNLKEMADKS